MLSRPSRRILLSASLFLAPATFTSPASAEDPVRTASARGAITTPSVALPESAEMLELPPVSDPVIAADVLTGEAARAFQIETLHAAVEAVQAVDGYTAELSKQERIDGELSDVQRISMKLRHAPHSVYMKWLSGDKGREVIYIDGANDGDMLVHAGGWRARFLPVLSIDPYGSLAMREARHPVTEAGLLGLVTKWLKAREADTDVNRVTYRVESDTFEGIACHKFVAEFKAQEQDPNYRRVTLWLDATRLIPIAALNHGWGGEGAQTPAQRDAATIVERYEYRDINLDAPLTDADFDRSNRKYAFRK